MSTKSESKLDSRAQKLLKLLIEHYIANGQPVASKSLAQDANIAASPATIRNIMAVLESAGYLHSPHTSAGRVPTSKAYRLFVDSLMTVQPFAKETIESLKTELNRSETPQNLLPVASDLLSSITKLAGVVTIPKRERSILRHVEFLPLTDKQVLVVLVLNNNHEVQNRIIHTARTYSPSELQQAGNYLNTKFVNKDLSAIRLSLQQELKKERNEMEKITQAIVEVADKAFVAPATTDYIVAGEVHLLDMLNETGVDQLRTLFEAFSTKKDILHLLEKCLHADGVQIYIGEESGEEILKNCSLVTKSYQIDGKIVGVLGVIGPTRMHYDHVVSAVDITAQLLGTALTI